MSLDANHLEYLVPCTEVSLKDYSPQLRSLFAELGDDLGPRGASQTNLRLMVPASTITRLCKGHFEGDPLVPGAYMVALCVESASRLVGPVTAVRRAIFRTPLRPEGDAHVEAQIVEGKRRTVQAQVRTPGGALAAKVEIEFSQSETRQRLFKSLELVGGRPAEGPLSRREGVSASLRHGPEALFVHRQLETYDRGAVFLGVERPHWHWSECLDGAAQAAGLCLRAASGSEGLPVYVAAYERLILGDERLAGPLHYHLRLRRQVMGLHQYSFLVGDAEGRQCFLSGEVAMVPLKERAGVTQELR